MYDDENFEFKFSRVKSHLKGGLTLFDMGGRGGMMAPKIFLSTVLNVLGGEG